MFKWLTVILLSLSFNTQASSSHYTLACSAQTPEGQMNMVIKGISETEVEVHVTQGMDLLFESVAEVSEKSNEEVLILEGYAGQDPFSIEGQYVAFDEDVFLPEVDLVLNYLEDSTTFSCILL
ncbi:MAG: hypothetical protein H6620_05390 [Halobacteriovoraceae bacterium]|nr:hypothetical protein [Halobacteriovoraceae bacterium]